MWVTLKDSCPFATMHLLPLPPQLVGRVLGREMSVPMGSRVSCCKVTVVPNTFRHQAVPLQVW